jgi:hypothetical protein
MIEINVSESYKKEVKKEAIVAVILISIMLVLIPPIMFMDYWYYAIALGVALIPFWVKFRWSIYKNELTNIKNHKLIFEHEVLNFHYENSKFSINLSSLKHLNVNIKNGHIDSIKLLFSNGNKAYLTKYNKMDNILKYLQSIVGEKNTSYHRWFHRH